MSRIRTIKPDFWIDEKVGECSPTARLLFISTWNFADDHGNLDRSAKQIKAQAFPYDNFGCEPLVQELLKVGLMVEYSSGTHKYLHINGFEKHQKIEKKSSPRFPLPDSSPTPPRLVDEQSALEGKGREGKGVEERPLSESKPDSDGFELVSPKAKPPDPILDICLPAVWDYYIVKLKRHPARTKLTPKRRSMFRARVQEFWPDLADPKTENAIVVCQDAINKLASNKMLNGENDANKKYIEWEHVFDSRERLEKRLNG